MLLVSPTRWWVLSLQGLFDLIFGLLIFILPSLGAAHIVVIFAGFALLNGLVGVLVAIRERRFLQHWWMNALIAAVNLGLGIFIFSYNFLVSPVSKNFLSVFIGTQALFQGSIGFGISLEMNREFKVRGAFLFYGILSMIGGILVLSAPYAPTLELMSLIGLYAILSAVGQGLDSLRLKRVVR